MRFGSIGELFRWYISQPAKCGPLTSHFSRLPSEVRTNAPLRVPTSNRTVLISRSLSVLCDLYSRSLHFSFTLRLSSCLDVTDSKSCFCVEECTHLSAIFIANPSWPQSANLTCELQVKMLF